MKNKLIIGRYLPNNSVIHHLDPRAKSFICIYVYYFNIFAHSFATFGWIILLILMFMFLAKIKLWFLIKGLTPIFIFTIFTFFMHIFFTHGGTRLVDFGIIKIDSAGIFRRYLYFITSHHNCYGCNNNDAINEPNRFNRCF